MRRIELKERLICFRESQRLIAGGLLLLSFAFSVSTALAQRGEVPAKTIYSDWLFGRSKSLLALEDKISPELLRETSEAETVSAVIMLSAQADTSAAYEIESHDERGWYVYHTLTQHAAKEQAALRAHLDSKGIRYRAFWIANMIVADIDRETTVEIAGRSDVARVESNRPASWIEKPEIANERLASSQSPEAIEWGVTNVNAPALWALGHTGNGIVVGGLDTGIRWTHNAIKSKYRGWNGTTANHNYNWYDSVHTGGGVCGANTVEPCDDNNHGSHTVGTMVGDDGTGNQIGVAPGAKWIGCRNMNVGDGTPATYAECFQFMIAPTDLAGNNPNPALRPHILNNSWGCPAGEGCTSRAELEEIVNNTQAAGIFVQASAGNTGSGCSSVAVALAIYDASFSAGAIDVNNSLVGFSSRGPSTYYNPNLLKPNISAPGSNVRSIGRASDTTYNFSSGTSMASPHVAGVVALLWSARPHLARKIGVTKALLQSTANPNVTVASQTCGGTASTQIPNNIFGWGRVDALAAYNASAPVLVSVSGRVLSPEGTPLRAAAVTLIDSAGVRRTATTSSFGVYTFEGVFGNEPYTLTATSKRFRFNPKSISVAATAFAAEDFVGLQ